MCSSDLWPSSLMEPPTTWPVPGSRPSTAMAEVEKTKRWLERQVMPSLLMIKEIEKKTGANYLEEIDRHTRLTEKQELKIKQMTTDIADMIEKDTAVPQGNDGIF